MHRLPHRAFLASVLCAAAGSLAVLGCGDAPTEPGALLVAPETEAALRIDRALPTLPRLIDATAPDSAAPTPGSEGQRALDRAEALWRDARVAPAEEAEALRREARRLAARPLADALEPVSLERHREDLAYWTEAASRLLRPEEASEIGRAVAAARNDLERSRTAEDPAAAVEALLRAADQLADVTPRAVALRLIRIAEEARAEQDSLPERERGVAQRRAARLLDGAYEALTAGDHVRAIRRAYYAGQLLRGR